ncbi:MULTISPECIES: hypothetical protein [unclassified Streptomyces]|uniref:hypothetical protein n=1 Tax=unclassified Streptomyces TaxID=2593676 RepID=UPI0033A9F7A1
MYKRMLRSVLATAFVAALACGVLSGGDFGGGAAAASAPSAAARGAESLNVPGDITWDSIPVNLAGV